MGLGRVVEQRATISVTEGCDATGLLNSNSMTMPLLSYTLALGQEGLAGAAAAGEGPVRSANGSRASCCLAGSALLTYTAHRKRHF